MMWEWHHGGGGKPRVGESLLHSGTMEWIDDGDKGLGMIRNGIPVRTLKLNFGVDIMLGEGGGIVGMKRGVAAEESVDDDVCAERVMSSCLCMRMEAIIPVDQTSTAFPIPGVFDDLGGDIAERAGDKDELLVGRVGKFFSVEGGQEWEMDLHAKVDYDDVTVGVAT